MAASSAACRPAVDAGAGGRAAAAWGVLTAMACGAVLVGLHARNALDSDEGVVLNGAWNLLHGRALYTDFFEFLAPGSFYLVLAAWKTFGSSFWVAKAVGLAALALAALGVYRLAALLAARLPSGVPPLALTVPPLLFCLFSGYLPAINHNAFHLPLAVWSTWFAVRGLQQASVRDCTIAGLLCGVGAWVLQHRSATIACATLAVLLLLAWRQPAVRWRRCAVAYSLAVAAPVIAMALFWDPAMLWEHLVVFPATRYVEVNRVDPTLIACAASFAVGATWLLRRRLEPTTYLLLALLGALLLTALQRPDASHVTSALWPLLCLLPLIVAGPAGSPSARLCRAWIAAGLSALPLQLVAMIVATPSLYLSDWSRQHPALQFIREHCAGRHSLYAGPFAAGLYYETGALNPTRYSVLLPRFNTDAQFRDAARDIDARRPRCAITNYVTVEKFGYSRENVVDEYLAANYQVVFEARHRQVWMARTQPLPAKPPVAASTAPTAAGR